MPRLTILLLMCLPTTALAQSNQPAPIAADGRVLGHLPYGDIPDDELADAPEGFALRQRCRLRREVIPDLQRLLAAAAADPATGGTLRGLSCHRSLEHQSAVFTRGSAGDAADRAISVAPAGHSEHTTGYALDFAVRPNNGCPDAEACMAALPAAAWLRKNAPRFGFEMSFPGGNKQGVKWEPWHWRWVGTSASEPGAARARFVFARARRDFPADPAVDAAVVIETLPPPVRYVDAPPSIDPKAKKKRRR